LGAKVLPQGYPYEKVMELLTEALEDMPSGITARFGAGQDSRKLMIDGPVVGFMMAANGEGTHTIRMDELERLPDHNIKLVREAQSRFGDAWVKAANLPEISALLLDD